MSECKHTTVIPGLAGDREVWVCQNRQCQREFVPVDVLEAMEVETNRAIDMACAMFANIITDVCTRLGQPKPAFVDDKDPTLCEDKGHHWEDGKCTRCGTPMFLGGG